MWILQRQLGIVGKVGGRKLLIIVYPIIKFQEIHDHSFAYTVIIYGVANMNQHEKRRVWRWQGTESFL
jgi:hypothetical protein